MAVSLLTFSATSSEDNGIEKNKMENKMRVSKNNCFDKIIIYNDIDVVLTEATENRIEIKGEVEDVKNVSFYVKKGILYIDSKFHTQKNTAVIYVSVVQLQCIEVNGRSKITSNGFLSSKILNVQVNEESNFELKNHGPIYFKADNEIDLHFERWKGPQQPG